MSVEIQTAPNGVGPLVTLDRILSGKIRHDVEKDPMIVWDKGVFLYELQRQGLVPSNNADGAVDGDRATSSPLRKGTYKGTQLALTELYSLLEEAYGHPRSFHVPKLLTLIQPCISL